MKLNFNPFLRSACLVASIALTTTQSFQAASATWDGDTNGNWNNSNNWSAAYPNKSGEIATFNADVANSTITLGADITITSIKFNTGAEAYTFNSGYKFILGGGGDITVASGVTTTQTVNTLLQLGGNSSGGTYNLVNESTTSEQSLIFGGNITGGTTGTAGAKILAVSGAGNISISGAIMKGADATSIALTKTGNGTLTLSSASNVLNTVNANGGVILISGSGVIGSTAALAMGGGQFNLGGTSRNVGAVTITSAYGSGDTIANGSLTGTSYAASNTSGTATVSAILGGASSTLAMNGAAGTLKLTNANTYGGTTTLTAGTLQIGVGNVGSVGSITSSAIGIGGLTFNGGTLSSDGSTARTILNAVTFTGNASLGNATNNGKLTFSAGANLGSSVRTITADSDVQFDGKITGSGGITLGTSTGYGKLTLANTTNDFTGNILLNPNSGTLRITSSGALGTGTKTITNTQAAALVPGTVANLLELDSNGGSNITLGSNISYSLSGVNGVILNTSGNNTIQGNIGMTTGNGTVKILSNGGTLTLSGTVTANTTRDFELAGSSTGANDFSGVLQNNGSNIATLAKTGTGTWKVSGLSNTFTGGVKINGGILQLGSTGAFNSTAGSENAVTFGDSSTGKLQLNGNSIVIKSLDSNATPGAPGVENANASNATLTIGNSTNTNSTFAGVIQNGTGAGTLALTKAGSGTVTLSGANTYTGATSINAGTLNITNTLTSPITVAANAFLKGEGATTGDVSFAAGSGFVFDPSTTGIDQHFRSTGTINTTAGGTTKIKIGLATAISSGTSIVVMEGANLTSNGASDFQLSSRGTLSTTSTQILFDYAAGNLVWKGASGTNPSFWDVNTTSENFTLNGLADDFYFDGDLITFDDTSSSSNVVVQGASVTPGNLTFNNTSKDYTVSGGMISGGASLTKNGSGTLTINNANAYTGTTILNTGTLRATTSTSALGAGTLSLAGGVLQLANDTGLNFGRNTTITGNSQITSDRLSSGDGVTHTLGTLSIGTQTLTFVKGSNVSGGTAGLNFGETTLIGNAIFDLGIDTNLTLGALGGNYDITKQGAGRLALGTTATRSGKTYINAGTLAISADSRLSLAPGSFESGNIVFNGGTIYLNYSNPTINAYRGILINAGGATLTALNGNYGFAGKIEGVGALTVTGPGGTSQYITGSSQHTYSGGTILSTGTAAVMQSTSDGAGLALTYGPFGTGTLRLQGGSIRASSTDITYVLGNAVSVEANTTIPSGGQAFEIAGEVTLTGSRILTQSSANTVTISGVIGDGGGNYGFTKTGTGVGNLIFTSANTYSGNTVVSAGILSLGNAMALQNSALDTTNSITGTSSGGLKTTVTTLTFGGLTGNKNLASIFTTTSGGYTGGVTTLTLNPGIGVSNSYGGIIANGASGMTLTKTGEGTQILTGANSYTGQTTIKNGTLALGSSGSIASSKIVVGDAGSTSANLDVSAKANFTIGTTQTLSGIGTVTGSTIISGTHAPGNSPGVQSFTGDLTYAGGSIFEWDLAANLDGDATDVGDTGTRGTDYDAVSVSGVLTIIPSATFKVIQNAGPDFTNTFWDTNQKWSNIFTYGSLTGGWNENTPVTVYNTSGGTVDVTTQGSFTMTGSTLTWTAVPEPTSALAGLLITAGLLRRRREVGSCSERSVLSVRARKRAVTEVIGSATAK